MVRIPRLRNRLPKELQERKEAADKSSKTAARRRSGAAKATKTRASRKVAAQALKVANTLLYAPGVAQAALGKAAAVRRQMAAAAREQRKRIDMSARAYDDRQYREAVTGEVKATDERLSKGDITDDVLRELHPGDTETREQRVKRVIPDPDPLQALLDRGSIRPREYDEGHRFGSAYERATREAGAINLDTMGGGFNGGLSMARCQAMSDLGCMVAKLADTEYDRLNRARILIEVCGKRRSLRDLAPGGRAFQRNSNILLTGLRMLAT